MRIIAGKARNLELNVPEGIGVRPTSGRGRKALLDSLGDMDKISRYGINSLSEEELARLRQAREEMRGK